MINRRSLLAGSAALAVLATAGAAHADAVEDFYRGKTVTIVVPVGPGGGTAAYFEVVARHLGRFIPGQPTVITNFMPGGGGVKAMLYGAEVAPRDGTTLLTPPDSVAVAQLVSPEATYDARAFTWLGTIAKTRAVLVMHKNSGVKTIDDLKAKETKIGAAGPGSSSQYDPTLANELIGTKMKVIVGYDGFGGSLKAMLGGELDGTTQNWQTWKGQKALFDDGTLVPVLQYGIEGEDRLPDIPNVPSLIEFVTNPEDKALVNFLESQGSVGRGLIVPPEVPEDRIVALRKALQDLTQDAEFKADIDRAILAIDPKPGEDVEKLVDEVLNTPPEIVERAKRIMAGG